MDSKRENQEPNNEMEEREGLSKTEREPVEPEIERQEEFEENRTDDELDERDSVTILTHVGAFFSFLGRTTVQYFRNLPDKIRNKIKAKISEHRRMPKRKSISKVYVLVGYTTKEYVDQKYRKEKALLMIRRILVAAIIILILIMTYRWIMPKLDTNEYKQMVGIQDIDDLTSSDPFATETTKDAIAPESQSVTPIPSDTTSDTTESSQPVV